LGLDYLCEMFRYVRVYTGFGFLCTHGSFSACVEVVLLVRCFSLWLRWCESAVVFATSVEVFFGTVLRRTGCFVLCVVRDFSEILPSSVHWRSLCASMCIYVCA
jgi:hypothetical protein